MPQSQHNFLTLTTALHWGHSFFRRTEHCAEDIASSGARSTVLRTCIPPSHRRQNTFETDAAQSKSLLHGTPWPPSSAAYNTFVSSWRRSSWPKRLAISCWLMLLHNCSQSIRLQAINCLCSVAAVWCENGHSLHLNVWGNIPCQLPYIVPVNVTTTLMLYHCNQQKSYIKYHGSLYFW